MENLAIYYIFELFSSFCYYIFPSFSFFSFFPLRFFCLFCLFSFPSTLFYSFFQTLRGAFNKFPDFFVQALETVVDSWKFTMLLLYILLDVRPIFMISASNERLQHQLEYTLLKPDYHSWWILKIQSEREEERYAIRYCFKLRPSNMSDGDVDPDDSAIVAF